MSLSLLVALTLGPTLAAAQPTLAVVDATSAGAPEVAAEVERAAKAAGRFDVRPREEIDGAMMEARRVGAACGIDDAPECWARLGIMASLDRILVVCVRPAAAGAGGSATPSQAAVEVLLVDVPARTAGRTSEPVGAEPDTPSVAARRAVQALLAGRVAPRAADAATPKKSVKVDDQSSDHGAGFWSGVYLASFGGVALVGCTVGAIAISVDLANQLHAAKDDAVPLRPDYPALATTFWVLSAGAALGGALVVTGVGLALVLE